MFNEKAKTVRAITRIDQVEGDVLAVLTEHVSGDPNEAWLMLKETVDTQPRIVAVALIGLLERALIRSLKPGELITEAIADFALSIATDQTRQ